MALPNPGGAAGTSGSAASSGFEYTRRRRLAETAESETGAAADDHLAGPLPSADALPLMAARAGTNGSSFRIAIKNLPSGPPMLAGPPAGDGDIIKKAEIKAEIMEAAAIDEGRHERRLLSGASAYKPPKFTDGSFESTYALWKSRSRCDFDKAPYASLYGNSLWSCALQCFNTANCYYFLVTRGKEEDTNDYKCYMVDTTACQSRKKDTSYTFDTYYFPRPAEYALVAKNSRCSYGAEREYLASYDFHLTDGYQACANKCRSVGGCTVFSMQNYKEKYPDPDLKDYDSRGCYWIKVSSAAECSNERSASYEGTNVYTLAGADGPESESAPAVR